MEGKEVLGKERTGRMGNSFQILLHSTQSTLIYNKFYLALAAKCQIEDKEYNSLHFTDEDTKHETI